MGTVLRAVIFDVHSTLVRAPGLVSNIAIDIRPRVMVGDAPGADGGAAQAGISTVIVPVVDDRPQLALVARMLAYSSG